MSVEPLLEKLKFQVQGCEDRCVDLKTTEFTALNGELCLESGGEKYYFKRDPKNPKDPKVVHAAKQFCKVIGVPYSFFAKNPDHMKRSLVEVWMRTLKSEKAAVLMKLRGDGDGNWVIRAILPVEFTNISNLDVIEVISESIGDDFKVGFVVGNDRDDLVLYVRFLSKEVLEFFGEKCSYGFSLAMSELGACPLVVDTLLFRNDSATAMIASYAGESFFKCEYENIQPNDLRSLFPTIVSHMKEQLPEIRERIQEAKELTEKEKDIRDLLKEVRLKKGLGDRFHTLLMQECDVDTQIENLWDFSNKVANVAKEFDVQKRLRIEQVSGELVGLCFAKA